ncbi:helix-turn-helix transcriptional regulator [Streptomyces sp. NPDC002766]|uniref:helix-turn-helix transcriptional regulator n=1 Tax=Streptomyces sp. NPDC002766 TaxID=3154429 RepID=UPI003326AD7E
MGRPENPIPDPTSPLGRLAVALRNGRRDASLSYVELSDRTRFISPGTLQRAASGTHLPRWEVAQAFARVCGMDAEEVARLWQAAYRSTPGRRSGSSSKPPEPRPDRIEDLKDFGPALEELRQANGAPSFRMMQSRARATGRELSRSTAYRISTGQQPPASAECVEAFLVACEVPPRERTAWLDAWRQAQWRAARQEAGRREEMRQLESVVAGNIRGQVSQETAVWMLRKAGFEALERFRRFDAPWSVECLECAATLRLRLSDIVLVRATCPECPTLTARVREAWAELVTNRSGLLSRQHVRALRAAAVLQPRLHRGHLDVPVFVADRPTLNTLQSADWHPALEEALRRHVRRPFYLDVLLVPDDTTSSRQSGLRHRRLAKAAGLIDGPLESVPPRRDVEHTNGAVQADGAAQRVATAVQNNTVRPAPDIRIPWKPTSNSGA